MNDEYKTQLLKLKKICEKMKKAPNFLDISQKYGLRSSRWFVSHCENTKVTDYNSFMEYEIGILPNYNCSKETVRDIVNNYFEKTGNQVTRKILDSGDVGISLSTIKRVFGSLRKMNEELGYEVLMFGGIDKKKSIDEMKLIIENFIIQLKTPNFSSYEFNSFCKNNELNIVFQTVNARFKQELNISLREYCLENFEVCLQKAGMGTVRVFEDGEVCLSSFEYEFSEYLKEIGFTYNKDYFRGIKYSSIFKNVKRNIDMDYYFPEKNIVIEIAGILRDYERFFKQNKIIKSSESKEKYRKSLIEKRNILKRNDVDFYFIFPNKNKNFRNIFEKINIFQRGEINA